MPGLPQFFMGLILQAESFFAQELRGETLLEPHSGAIIFWPGVLDTWLSIIESFITSVDFVKHLPN